MNQIKELSARLDGLERRVDLSSGVGRFGVFKVESLIGKFTSENVEHMLGRINQESAGDIAVQVVLNVEGESDSEIDIEIVAGDIIFYRGSRSVNSGTNEIFLVNTFSLARGEEVDIKLFVSSASGTNYVKDATVFVWSSTATVSSDSKLSISADKCEDDFVVCYLIDGKVYVCSKHGLLEKIVFDDFSYYADARAVDCAILKSSEGCAPYIFRLTSDGCVYYSSGANVQNERVCVSGGVQNFSVSALGDRSGVLVTYIKNDFPFYKTIEGENLSLENEFPAKKSKKYSAICALKTGGSGNAVVVTTDTNSNFIFELAPDLNFGHGDKIYCTANISYL